MASIGLYYPVAAEISEEKYGNIPEYKSGIVIGKAITADVTINTNDNPLYADNSIAENDRSFSDGTIKIGVDDIDLKTEATLLGNKYTAAETDPSKPEIIVKSSGQIAPYFGIGYYKPKIKSNKKYYEATWFYKVQFSPFSETGKTKEKSIEWQTPEIEGSIMIVDGYEDGAYETKAKFSTEAAARAWLNTQANITTEE